MYRQNGFEGGIFVMDIKLTNKQLRLLLDLVYVGNWVMNSPRADERILPYDQIESLIFEYAVKAGIGEVAELTSEGAFPSQAYIEGGIHEAIMDYEDSVFFNILSEELARRDLKDMDVDGEDRDKLETLTDIYYNEFFENGIDNISVEGIDGDA